MTPTVIALDEAAAAAEHAAVCAELAAEQFGRPTTGPYGTDLAEFAVARQLARRATAARQAADAERRRCSMLRGVA